MHIANLKMRICNLKTNICNLKMKICRLKMDICRLQMELSLCFERFSSAGWEVFPGGIARFSLFIFQQVAKKKRLARLRLT